MTTIQADICALLTRNSIPEPNSGCWIWLGAVAGGKKKYPIVRRDGRNRQATHFALQLRGIDVGNHDACHRCDNNYCVNPDHLFVGTRKINMQDARAKGRLVGYGKREFCKQGHPLSGANVRIDPKTGKRQCKICKLHWGRITDAKRRPRRDHNP